MTLPLGFSPGLFALTVLCIFMVGVSKSGFAAGFTSVTVAVLANFTSPALVLGLMLPLMMVIDTTNIWNYRRHFTRNRAMMFIPAAALGVGIGALTFGAISIDWIKISVGLIALWFSALHYLGRYLPRLGRKLPVWSGAIFAAMSGFTSHMAHAGAPPLRAFLLNQKYDKSELVGTFALVFTVVNWLKLPPYMLQGMITTETLLMSALLLPVIPFGIWAGLRLHSIVSQKLFMQIAYALLLLSGLRLLYDGIVSVI